MSPTSCARASARAAGRSARSAGAGTGRRCGDRRHGHRGRDRRPSDRGRARRDARRHDPARRRLSPAAAAGRGRRSSAARRTASAARRSGRLSGLRRDRAGLAARGYVVVVQDVARPLRVRRRVRLALRAASPPATRPRRLRHDRVGGRGCPAATAASGPGATPTTATRRMRTAGAAPPSLAAAFASGVAARMHDESRGHLRAALPAVDSARWRPTLRARAGDDSGPTDPRGRGARVGRGAREVAVGAALSTPSRARSSGRATAWLRAFLRDQETDPWALPDTHRDVARAGLPPHGLVGLRRSGARWRTSRACAVTAILRCATRIGSSSGPGATSPVPRRPGPGAVPYGPVERARLPRPDRRLVRLRAQGRRRRGPGRRARQGVRAQREPLAAASTTGRRPHARAARALPRQRRRRQRRRAATGACRRASPSPARQQLPLRPARPGHEHQRLVDARGRPLACSTTGATCSSTRPSRSSTTCCWPVTCAVRALGGDGRASRPTSPPSSSRCAPTASRSRSPSGILRTRFLQGYDRTVRLEPGDPYELMIELSPVGVLLRRGTPHPARRVELATSPTSTAITTRAATSGPTPN